MDNSGGNMFFLTGFWRRLSSAFLAFAIVLATIPVTIPIAFAATVTWDGDGGDSVWSTCTNWSGNSCPGSGDDALIDTAVTVKLTAATTINSLTLGVSAGNVASVLSFDYDAIGGSPLTVNGNVTMYGSSKITHTDNTSATSYRANLDINGSFTLNSVASIDVRAKGFTGGATDTNGNGTSPGTWNTYTGGGGAHAGTGGRSACSSSNNGGASPYGSSNNPVTIGSGGSGGTDAGAVGGDGGGAVKIDVAGTFTLNGTISADGANGSASNANTNAGGGGAGGSVQVIASTLSGSGTIDADGGNGGNGAHRDGGGGGAGRILIRYTSTTIATSSFNTMVGALGGSVDTTFNQCASPLPVAGQNGSAIILDLASDLTNFTDADAYIIDGYRFESGEENSNSGTRFRFNNITVLGTATSGTGLAAIRNNTTASIVDADGTLKLSNAAWTCSSVTTLQVDAATLALDNETSDDVFTLTSCGTWTLNVTSSITSTLDNLTISTTAIDWNVPASTTLTLSDSTITTTATTRTAFTIDDAITLNLGTADNTNASTVTSNATLTISTMTIYAGSTWSSNALGCAAGSGGTTASGPNGSNVCATSTTGYGRDGSYAGGGGGHGGAGGASVDGTASSTYDTATDPTTYRLGSGGARGEGVAGGTGGGYVKLDVSGTLTLNGTITANGGVGVANTNNGGGGGSGGSVYILASTLAGGSGGNVTAKGGVGGNAGGGGRGGGGGGGGLIYLSYGSDTSSWRSGVSSANTTTGGGGGTGGIGAGTAGSNGTLTQVDVPVFSSALYKDSDANGVVDQVVITFDESVSLGGTVASTRFTWTSVSGANGFAGTLSGNASASGTDVTITIGSAEANETGHTTVPTIAYNDNSDDGTNKIQDTDGNIVQTFTAQNVSDGAKPAFVSATTTSTTTVRLTMSEAVSSVTFGAAGGWTATGLTPSAVAINSDTTKLDLTVSAVNQGYTASNFAFTSGVSGSAISDAASNATASFTSKSITDGVAPDAPGSFTRSTGSGTTATFTWTVTPDTNFNHYEIWYGTNSTHVTNRNNTASEWDNDPNDATLATRTTTTTTVTGLTAGSTYYALICAVDNASNETCTSSISFVTNQAPTAATVTGSEATDGTGNVTVSFIMDDPDDDNTLQALVEYSTNGGTSWSKATLSIVDADTTATYGTPRVDNSATYQVGKASNYITSSSGANTVTVKWPSSTDAPTANISNAKIRVTPYDGVAAGTAATSSDFTLDNVDPSNPTVDSSTTVSGPGLTFDTTITGTKDANTAIRNNGTQVVELDSNTTWSYNVRLATGDNVYSFTAIDAKGNESSATSHTIVYTRQDGAVVIRRGGNSKSSDGDSEVKDSGINDTPDDKKVESTLAPPEPQQPPADPEDAKKKLLDAASVVVDTINGAMKEDVGTLIEKAEEAEEEEEEKEKKKIEEPSFEIVTVAVDEKPIEILATREKMLETEDYQKITPVDEAGIPVWIQQKFSKDKKGEKAITKDSDLDGDNILDMEEILLGTKLDSKDSDGDGISDDKEITQGINPTAWDTDHDGVSDRNEALHGTNPKNPDSDNDGFLDMEEISAGSDPKDNKDKPHLNKQGIPEEWVNKYGDWKEVKYNKPQKIRGIEKEVTMSFAMMDMDGDGLTDENEYRLGTNPTHEDTDRDGVPDGTEVHDYKTDPTRDTETELLYSTKASNLKPQGNAFAGTPVVRGIAQPNSTVEVIFLPSQKEKSPTAWMLFASSFGVDTNGIITELIQTDSIGKFLISPKVKDGDYIVVIRSLDTNGAIIEESLPYEVKIDSSLSLLAEKIVIPLQLDTKAIDIENLQLITIDNNRPYLYGTAKKGYEVVISWKSQLYTSSLVVDTDEGEFVTLAPADLDSGEHSLYIYAVEPAKNLSTPPITINFNILDLDADFNILSTASIFTDWKLLARVGIPLLLILILSLILIRVKFRGKIL